MLCFLRGIMYMILDICQMLGILLVQWKPLVITM